MCLILFAWKVRAEAPLVVAANRDELHARPALPAAFWPEHPDLLAGRDLQANGTWLGLSRGGRFASVTNFRGGHDPKALESRGALVTRFLLGALSPAEYLRSLNPGGYSGFNLLLADRDELWWLSNRSDGPRRLEPGHYALGNLLLDTPEVQEVRERFEAAATSVEPLFAVLSGARIVAPVYGTRCSTVLFAGADGRLRFAERVFDAGGADRGTLRYEFEVSKVRV
jgi:uncharacterized protein with NRDE domain